MITKEDILRAVSRSLVDLWNSDMTEELKALNEGDKVVVKIVIRQDKSGKMKYGFEVDQYYEIQPNDDISIRN